MTAARKLEPQLAPADDDPILRAARNAPMGEPFSEEENAVFEQGERFFEAGGRGKSQEEIEEMLERRRREQR